MFGGKGATMARVIVKKRASGARDGQTSDDELRRVVEQSFGAMILVHSVAASEGRGRDIRIVAVNDEAARLIDGTSAALLKGK